MTTPKEISKKQIYSVIDFMINNTDEEKLEHFSSFIAFAIGSTCNEFGVSYDLFITNITGDIINDPYYSEEQKQQAQMIMLSILKVKS